MSDIKQRLRIVFQQPNTPNSTTDYQLTVNSINGRLPQNDGFLPNFKSTLEELLPEEHDSNYSEKSGKKFGYTANQEGVARFEMHQKGYKFMVTLPNGGPIDGHEFIQAYVNRLSREYQLEK